MPLSYERHAAEIITQTNLLTEAIDGVDLTRPVPSCPGWSVGMLLRHIGYGHRYAEEIVRTKAIESPSDEPLRNLDGYSNEDPAVLIPWLTDGADALGRALRNTTGAANAWVPVPTYGTMAFWARRFANETVMHRADAVLALDSEFTLAEGVALDVIDEWMELDALPFHFEYKPAKRELLGPDRTVHLHATDSSGEWVVDLTGDVITWRRAHEKATVAVRGPLTELLLMIYHRRSVDGPGLEVFGDRQLLDAYLEQAKFG